MKKMILIFTYILTLAMLPLRTVCAQDIWETYENGDGTLIITGYHGAGGDIIIPSEIDGKTVSSVDQNVLSAISETATSFSAEPGSPIYTAENGVLYSSPYTEAPEQKFVAAYPKASDAEEFYVPDYVWQFETGACSNADSLKKVSLPQGIDAVNTDAFAGCDNLVELEFRGEYSLPHGTYIDDEGYYHDKDGSYISGGLLIGDGAFSGCTALKSVILPQGTSMILENAFSGCSSLEAVLIPESVSYFTDSPLSAAIFDGSPLAVVYCLPDSPAQEYCELNGVPFRAVASYEEGVSLINDISSAPADAVSEKPSDWAVTEVNAARSNGLIPQELDSGYTLPITRREFCLLVGAYADKMGLNGTSTATFNDTNAPEILKAASLGVINGYPDGSFSPDSSILRSEAAAMLSRTVSLTGNTPNAPYSAFDDEHLFGWAKDNIGFISSCIDTKNVTAIMGGVGSNLFDPNGNYTREQAILTFQRLYRYCTGVIQPLYDGNIPVELNGGAKVTFDGKLLKFSDLDAENYHIVVHSGMRFYDYDNTVKSDTITVSGSEFVYDISDLNSGRYIAVIRPVTLNTYAYAQIPEPPLDGSIFSAAPTIAEPPYVYIIKDNDHGYFMPYPAYEYNKKMFDETKAPEGGEYLSSSESIQSDNAEIRALAESITAGCSTAYEKASAVYDWMGENIAYDYDTYYASDPSQQKPQDAVSVMNQRCAVCEGYSNLSAALLRSLGIPTKYVTGYPVVDYGAGETTDDWIYILMNGGDEENGIYLTVWHAWNEVWIGDRWIIMDTTWGRNQDPENWDDFVTQRDYFDPSLWKFSYSHIILDYPDIIS